MRKINTFFHVLLNSLLPLKPYYKKLHTTRLSFSIKYFFTLIILLNALGITLLLLRHSSFIRQRTDPYASFMSSLDSYPQDLVVRISNGHLTTNSDQPYFMWIIKDTVPHPLVVVDKQARMTDNDRYEATVLLASNGIVFTFDDKPQYYGFSSADSYVIDHSTISALKDKFSMNSPKLPFYILLAGIGLFLVVPLIIGIFNLILLSIVSYGVFFVTRTFFKHAHVKYRNVLQVSLHTSTIPLIIDFLFFGLGITIAIPLGTTLLYILFLTGGMYEVYGVKRTRS